MKVLWLTWRQNWGGLRFIPLPRLAVFFCSILKIFPSLNNFRWTRYLKKFSSWGIQTRDLMCHKPTTPTTLASLTCCSKLRDNFLGAWESSKLQTFSKHQGPVWKKYLDLRGNFYITGLSFKSHYVIRSRLVSQLLFWLGFRETSKEKECRTKIHRLGLINPKKTAYNHPTQNHVLSALCHCKAAKPYRRILQIVSAMFHFDAPIDDLVWHVHQCSPVFISVHQCCKQGI